MKRFDFSSKDASVNERHTIPSDDAVQSDGDHNHMTLGAYELDVILIVRLIASALLFIAGEIISTPEWAGIVALILSAIVAGYDVLISAITNIANRKLFDECFLMTLAAVAAFIIGEGHEGAAVMLLYQIGELLQSIAVGRTRHTIESKTRLQLPRHDAGGGRTEKFITRFSKIYTPVVMLIALLTAVLLPILTDTTISEAVHRALAVLVIACPCALVVSVPLAYFAGMGRAATYGILFKSSEALDSLSEAKVVVFDKAGTLTAGEYRVVSVRSDKLTAPMLLKIAAHAEAHSSHPIARAIIAAHDGGIDSGLIDSFMEYPGEGVSVRVDAMEILVGSQQFLSRHFVTIRDDELTAETAVYMSVEGLYAGRILLGDPVRDGSANVIRDLESSVDIAMLTEENSQQGKKLADKLGIKEFYSDQMPAEKAIRVREMKSRAGEKGTTVFVGEGKSSADAMSEADVGIAICNSNTSSAPDEADIIILDDSPSKVSSAIFISKETKKIIFQNTGFIIAIKLAVIVLGFWGISPIWFAIFADSGVTILSILSSMRAFGVKLPE